MDAQLSKVSEDKVNGVWRAPHTYSYFDTRILRRTNKLLADRLNQPYGLDFNFTEYAFLPVEAQAQVDVGQSQAQEAPAMPEGTSQAAGGLTGVMITKEEEKKILEAQG